jgi:tetratricopeptide (TPR) repeat protein
MKPSDRPSKKDVTATPKKMTLGATFGDGSTPAPASRGNSNQPTPASGLADLLSWPGRACLLLAVLLAPWFWGSVFIQPQKWIAISLLAGLAFWWFETAMNTRRHQVFPLLFFPVFLGILLAIFQLIPLPESLTWLLGRQTEIYAQMMGDSQMTAGISVDRFGTQRHLCLLTIALAALLLGCRYFRSKRDLLILMTALTLNGAVIAFFGIIHRLTFNGKLFWVYEITGGHPFGPYVNRNNACCYLLICMAAAVGLLPILLPSSNRSGPRTIVSREIPLWRQITTHLLEFIADINAKKIAVLLAIVLIGTGIIVSLSRGGVISLLTGGIVSVIAYGMARQPKNSMFIFVPLLLLIGFLIGFVALGDGLTERFEQTETVDISKDGRFNHWQSTWPATQEFGLLGSGLGSYVGVHRSYRNDVELTVFHFAENQYFQALVEGGWPALLLLLSAWVIAFQSASMLLSRGQSATTVGVGLMGTFIISSQAVASFFDFGFYIPANMLALAVVFGFLSFHAQSLGNRLKKKSWIRLQLPNLAIQTLVIVLFGCTCLVAYELHKQAKVESISTPKNNKINRTNMPLVETEDRIARLQPLALNNPTPKSLNYLAGLYVHRCRLQLFETISDSDEFKRAVTNDSLSEKSLESIYQNWWDLTHLQQLQENAYYLRQESPLKEFRKFLEQPAIQENLPQAAILLRRSRELSPLQPITHLRLGQILAIAGNQSEADESISRTTEIAPANPKFQYVAGIYYLQSGRPAVAVEHLRKYLELAPNKFGVTMDLVTGRTNRSIIPLDPQLICKDLIPDDANMLFRFVKSYDVADPAQKIAALERAEKILLAMDYRSSSDKILLGNILSELGKKEAAIEEFSAYLRVRPNDLTYLKKRADLNVDLGNLKLALEDADKLARKANKPEPYKAFVRKLRRMIDKQNRDQRNN